MIISTREWFYFNILNNFLLVKCYKFTIFNQMKNCLLYVPMRSPSSRPWPYKIAVSISDINKYRNNSIKNLDNNYNEEFFLLTDYIKVKNKYKINYDSIRSGPE